LARSISITNLSERVPVVSTGDELQRLAETCNAMLERLEIAVNRIKQFTADASHDLRGPISCIRTVAEVALRNPTIQCDSHQAFNDIVEESVRASALLEDLLTLARADANRADTIMAPLDITTIVEETCERVRPMAAQREQTLSVIFDSQRTVNVLGESSSLRRLLWILLDNAIKYTPLCGRIDVTLRTSALGATVTVRDNGIGIPSADLPHIFDRFYRADPSRGNVEGSGLGLSIAKWIAETYHAQLSVVSNESDGTAFSVIFPSIPLSRV
jgi:signal transduction histidine kinase